jgi:hypothetical protein
LSSGETQTRLHEQAAVLVLVLIDHGVADMAPHSSADGVDRLSFAGAAVAQVPRPTRDTLNAMP